jgi:hypothetical protein
MSNGVDTSYVVPFVINGEDYIPEKSFDVVSPLSGKVIHRCGSASLADVSAAADAAASAFKEWRLTTPTQRRDIFLKAAEICENRRPTLVKHMRDETGADEGWCNFNIGVTIDGMKDVAGRISSIEGAFPATQNPDVSAIVMREPYGVVLSIAPWSVTWCPVLHLHCLTRWTGMPLTSSPIAPLQAQLPQGTPLCSNPRSKHRGPCTASSRRSMKPDYPRAFSTLSSTSRPMPRRSLPP